MPTTEWMISGKPGPYRHILIADLHTETEVRDWLHTNHTTTWHSGPHIHHRTTTHRDWQTVSL